MCPGTIAIIGAVSGAAGAVTSGIAQGNAASYQARVASNNAIIARQNAGYAAGAASTQIEEAGLKASARDAGVRAAIAANGVDVNSGSAVDVQQSQREIGALDTATVANKSALQVYGYETQGTGFQGQSQLDRSEVGADYLGGALKAGGALAANPAVDSSFSSLLSSTPRVPSDYAWMSSGASASPPAI